MLANCDIYIAVMCIATYLTVPLFCFYTPAGRQSISILNLLTSARNYTYIYLLFTANKFG